MTHTSNQPHNNIIDAPSLDGLKDAYFKRECVYFTVQGPEFCRSDRTFPKHKIVVILDLLQHEDDNGSFNFEASIKNSELTHMNGTKVKGFFRTSDRKGWINVVLPKPKIQGTILPVRIAPGTDIGNAKLVSPINFDRGEFTAEVVMVPGEGCAFENQVLAATWSRADDEWYILHPNC